jgi:hypothetical protein
MVLELNQSINKNDKKIIANYDLEITSIWLEYGHDRDLPEFPVGEKEVK